MLFLSITAKPCRAQRHRFWQQIHLGLGLPVCRCVAVLGGLILRVLGGGNMLSSCTSCRFEPVWKAHPVPCALHLLQLPPPTLSSAADTSRDTGRRSALGWMVGGEEEAVSVLNSPLSVL